MHITHIPPFNDTHITHNYIHHTYIHKPCEVLSDNISIFFDFIENIFNDKVQCYSQGPGSLIRSCKAIIPNSIFGSASKPKDASIPAGRQDHAPAL